MKKLNVSPLVGAMREHLQGKDKVEGGLAALAVGLADSLDAVLSCEWADERNGRDVFTVREYITDKPRNEGDQSHWRAQQELRNSAMLTQLFGFESYAIPDGAKQARDKALPAAIALDHFYRDGEGKLSIYVRSVPGSTGNKRNVLGGIPAADMFSLVDADGALTPEGKATFAVFAPVFHRERKRFPHDDAELQGYMVAYPVESTGSLDPSFRTGNGKSALRAKSSSKFLSDLVEQAIKAGVLPPPPPRNTKGKVDAGLDIDKSAKLLVDWVAMISAPDGEVDAAPNDEREAALDRLCEAWAAYRVANPRGDLPF